MLKPEEFEILWRRAERSVVRVAAQCGSAKCVDDREDLLQRVRLRAWKGIKDFDHERKGAFTRWVCQIAARVCIETLRESYRARRLNLVEAVPDEEGLTILDAVASGGPSALDDILSDETMAELRRGIAGMPDGMLKALHLTVEGLTPQEIAEELHIKVDAVRSRLLRARQWVHKHLA